MFPNPLLLTHSLINTMNTTENTNIQEFINQSSCPELSRAVIDAEGQEDFAESAADCAKHGAASGCMGAFIYYSDTCKFYDANKRLIMGLAKTMAENGGISFVEMIASLYSEPQITDETRRAALNFLVPTHDEETETLEEETERKSYETHFKNHLTWYAVESVCQEYVNFLEQ